MEEFQEAGAPEGRAEARGPEGWENWKAYLEDKPPGEAVEVPLYTDSHMISTIDSLGPYRLLNTVPASWRADAGHAELAVVLRVDVHDDFEPDHRRDDWETADLGSYHGGWLDDEIAALVSPPAPRPTTTWPAFGASRDRPPGRAS